MTGTLHKDFFTFMTMSGWILLIMRNVLDKIWRENQNTHFLLSNFFKKLCCLWDNVKTCGGVRGTTNDVAIWCIRVACWISKATCTLTWAHPHMSRPTHTHLHIHAQIYNIYCFSTAIMMCKCASLLCYTYIACLVKIIVVSHTLHINYWSMNSALAVACKWMVSPTLF